MLKFEIFSTKNNFADCPNASGLIFSKKFCTLQPVEFWKANENKVTSEEREPVVKLDCTMNPITSESKGSSTFTTKASLKEMPGNSNTPQTFPPALVPKNQVQ